MSKRGILVGGLGAGLLLLGAAGPAAANVEWCSGDPPIAVVTPAGNHLMVNNMLYLSSAADKANVKAVTHDASTASDGKGGTRITVHLYFPDNFSDAYVVSSVNRFGVQDSAGTNGGATGNNVVTL